MYFLWNDASSFSYEMRYVDMHTDKPQVQKQLTIGLVLR
jgi:hypothetical protein